VNGGTEKVRFPGRGVFPHPALALEVKTLAVFAPWPHSLADLLPESDVGVGSANRRQRPNGGDAEAQNEI
jgi:hypothetical protein